MFVDGGVRVEEVEGEIFVVALEREGEAVEAGGGAVFDGEQEVLSFAAEIEVAVAPAVEIGAAAEGLSGAGVAGAFSGMMHQEDGGAEASLQGPQVGEQGRDLGDGVLVTGVEPHEGIENEQRGLHGLDGLLERLAVVEGVESDLGSDDGEHVEGREVDAGFSGDALESAADDVGVIFGRVEEHAPGLVDGKVAEARGAGSDGHGEIEGEEGLARLRLAADDADGLVGPESLDKPALLLGHGRELADPLDRESHHRRPLVRRVAGAADWGG
jgi:hypothetical protein